MPLPVPLSPSSAARIDTMLDTIRDEHGGNGFVGTWCAESRQSFLGVVAGGVLRAWCLAPAATEAHAERVAVLLRDAVIEAARFLDAGSAEAAAAAIRGAQRN